MSVFSKQNSRPTLVKCCERINAPLGRRLATWVSWFCLVAAFLTAVMALFCQWGVNAESLGAHDMGWALFLAYAGALALISSFWAVPVLLVLGLLALLLDRPAGFRFLIAGMLMALPLAVLTWLEWV